MGICDGAVECIFVGVWDTVGLPVGGSVGEAEGGTVISLKQKSQASGQASCIVLPSNSTWQYLSFLACFCPNHAQEASFSLFLMNV